MAEMGKLFFEKDKPRRIGGDCYSEPMIEQALEAEVLFSQDKIVWWEYEKAEKERRDKIAIRNTARNAGADEVNRLNVILINLADLKI